MGDPAVSEGSTGEQQPDPSIAETVQAVTRANLRTEVPLQGATFVELGGDSIGAMQMSDELRARIGVDVPMEMILGATDLQDLAERLESSLREAGGSGGRDG